MAGTRGGISEAVSGFQATKRYRSLVMASMWLWCAVDGAHLMANENKLKVCMMQSLVVSYSWLT